MRERRGGKGGGNTQRKKVKKEGITDEGKKPGIP